MKIEKSIIALWKGDSSVGIDDASMVITFDPPLEFEDDDEEFRKATLEGFYNNPHFEDCQLWWGSDWEKGIEAENAYIESILKEQSQ